MEKLANYEELLDTGISRHATKVGIPNIEMSDPSLKQQICSK